MCGGSDYVWYKFFNPVWIDFFKPSVAYLSFENTFM